MNTFYIYKFLYEEEVSTDENDNSNLQHPQSISVTVIFCDRQAINELDLRSEISSFYEENYQTDKIFVIGAEYMKADLRQVFIKNWNETFRKIPRRNETFLRESIHILTFNKDGRLVYDDESELSNGLSKKLLNEGLQNIFIKRGGLITSEGTHHFMFASGKHCDKFLRTGNILLFSSEIYFIAFALLPYFKEEEYNRIYCDTSSINSIAFALIELKNRFLAPGSRKQIPIESFSSYDGLYKYPNINCSSLILISASTSGNIVDRITKKNPLVASCNNRVILFFLGDNESYTRTKAHIACNLTKTDDNENGIPNYIPYDHNTCEHCKSGSHPVPVSGDVLLFDKPKINKVILSKSDAEKNLSAFVRQFMSTLKDKTVLKVNYKKASGNEDTDNKYEIFIDFDEILEGLGTNRYGKFKGKLGDYINQYVPSNTKYIISLIDDSSVKLAKYILGKIENNYRDGMLPKIVRQLDIVDSLNNNDEGTVLVVGSCISNGKNLLYISRALRNFNKLKIIYFLGIIRSQNNDHLEFLKKNLKQGNYGGETNGFVVVETIFCNNESRNTEWVKEISFLKDFIDFVGNAKESRSELEDAFDFLRNRKSILERSQITNGLSNNLFYPKIFNAQKTELGIQKNFAFFNFDDYTKDVCQSDIYFTISNVINSLRNASNSENSLKQTVYVRSLLHPRNFYRFNEGIIQASILRAACAEELAYAIDFDTSREMYNALEDFINNAEKDKGEAPLLEFFYAIASRKMSLHETHLRELVKLGDEKCKDPLFTCFIEYIRKEILKIATVAESGEVVV